MDVDKIKKGMKVFIKRGLESSRTKDRFELDSSGYMLKMQGRICTVMSVEHPRKIRVASPDNFGTYLFDTSDLLDSEEYLKDLPPTPEPVMFDTERLDI